MIKRIYPVLLGGLLLSFCRADEINYRPVVTTPRTYSNNEFDPRSNFTFEYNVYDRDGDFLSVYFRLSFDGGQNWFIPRNISGDVGHRIRSQTVPLLWLEPAVDSLKPDLYSLTWEIPREQWWLIDFDNLQWKITADDHFDPPDRYEWVTVPVDHEEINNANHDERKFHIMKYEVTNSQYVDFLNLALEAGQLSITNDWVGYYVEDESVPLEDALCFFNQKVGDGNWESLRWDGERFSNAPGTSDFPVLFVTYKGAQAFADFFGWQLPTREQWYRAALGYLQQRFPWGDYVEYQQANFWDSQDPYDNGPTPVGFYDGRSRLDFQTWDSPSRYGCYDMVGNVREWLRDETVIGGSWYTTNPRDISTQTSSSVFDLYKADFQTGFRCVMEYFGR